MSRRSDLGMREHLAGFLAGNDSVLAFQHWFARAMPEIEADADEDTYELALHVENRLAEFTGGHIDANRLRDVLRDEIGSVWSLDVLVVPQLNASARQG